MTADDRSEPSNAVPSAEPVHPAEAQVDPRAVEPPPGAPGSAKTASVGPGTDTTTPAPPGASDRVLLEGPHSRLEELGLLSRAILRFHPRISRAALRRAVRHRVRLGAVSASRRPYYALAREVGRRVSALGFTVLTGGGPGPHGSGEPRRARCRRPLGRLQHRAADGAGPQPVSRSLGDLPLLLRPQSPALQVLLRVRRACRAASARSTRCARR